MPPFELLFGRNPRISLDTLVRSMDNSEQSGGLDALVKQRRQMPRDVKQTLEKRHGERVESRQAVNARMKQPSVRIVTTPGNLVLLKEADSTIHRTSSKGKLKR